MLEKARVIQTWTAAGVRDFYISFEFEAERKWHKYSTFFCHQGLEKICKAYIIAESASRWEHLPEDQALDRVQRIAKNLGHDLKTVINCLRSRNVLPKPSRTQRSRNTRNTRSAHSGSYSENELVEILEASYFEARYPIPKSSQIHRKYPLSNSKRMFSDPIGETAPIRYARKMALAVLKRIDSDFSIYIPKRKKAVQSGISDESWKRFHRVFFRK